MLLDSNILILASKLTNASLLAGLRKTDQKLAVSVVSKIETLGYHQLREMEKVYLQNFFLSVPNLGLDILTVEKAIELRQRKPMSLADSILAATAIVCDLELLTENTKDFQGIPNLRLLSMADFIARTA